MSPVVALGSPQLSLSPVNWFGSTTPAIPDMSQTPASISVAPSSLASDSMGLSPSTGFAALEGDFNQYIASTSGSYFTGNEKDLVLMDDLGGLDSFSMIFNENETMSLAETLPTSDEAGTPILFSSNPSSAISSSSSQFFPSGFTSETRQNNQNSNTTESQCGCSLWAVGLVKLFHAASPADFSPASGASTPTYHIQSTISRNKKAIDRIDAILQCSCTHDSYLLIMLSMILMKVMDCYADAAQNKRVNGGLGAANGNEDTGSGSSGTRRHESTDHAGLRRPWTPSTQSPGVSDKGKTPYGSGTEGASLARCSMHLVLGELHRPQRLVNQISGLLKAQEVRSSGHETNSSHFLDYSSLGPSKLGRNDPGPSTVSSFSDVLLRQLGLDLRRRLQKLSLEIRQALKRE